MWLAARCGPTVFRALAYPLMFIALLGLVVVLFVPTQPGSAGAARPCRSSASSSRRRSWPSWRSWGADLLARKDRLSHLDDWRYLLIPLMPGAGILCMLVMVGDDLGTTFVLLLIFLTLLWVVGTPLRLYMGMLGLIVLALLMLAVVAQYRSDRLAGFFRQRQPGRPEPAEHPGQVGGRLGRLVRRGARRQQREVGLGARLHDRLHLRHPRRGTGLVGTLCVTFLYGGLAYAGLRIARRVEDTFMRLAAGGRHHLDRRPGAGEHLRGDRPAADHRRPAAADLRRAVLAAGDDGGAGHADVVRPARHRAPARRWLPPADIAAARPELAGPGPGAYLTAGRAAGRLRDGSRGRGRAGGQRGRCRAGGGRSKGRMSLSVVLAGGGTAGHIAARAGAGRRGAPGRSGQPGSRAWAPSAAWRPGWSRTRGYDLALIPPVPLPRSSSPSGTAARCRGGWTRRWPRPGGCWTSPGPGAGRLRRVCGHPGLPGRAPPHVPIVVHEANARPGLANRIGARFTRHVFTGQPDTRLPHASYVGIPLRREIAGLDRLALADKARLRTSGSGPTCRCCWSPAARRAPGR